MRARGRLTLRQWTGPGVISWLEWCMCTIGGRYIAGEGKVRMVVNGVPIPPMHYLKRGIFLSKEAWHGALQSILA
jgi:hypothetical protein